MTQQQAELIKNEINRLTLALDKYEPQTHQQPLELVEAYRALIKIEKGEGCRKSQV